MKGRKPEWMKYSKEELQEKLYKAKFFKDFAIELGYRGAYSKIKKDILKMYPDLDMSHFTIGVFQDLTGQQFGRLKVLERDYNKKDEVWWICECNCEKHTIKSYRADAIKRGTKSCGCLRDENRRNRLNDLSGQKFGHLKVLQRDFSVDDGRVRYLCECDCENKTKVVVLADNLRRNHTSSCGCIRSSGEDKVQIILSNLGFNFKREYTFKDLCSDKGRQLRFDFAIFDNDGCIKFLLECQGQQHYSPSNMFGGEEQFKRQKEHDELKRKYCINKNISFYIIPYWDYTKISEEYIQELIN